MLQRSIARSRISMDVGPVGLVAPLCSLEPASACRRSQSLGSAEDPGDVRNGEGLGIGVFGCGCYVRAS